MKGNNLGPVDKTVSILIDRSYPVVKAVYENLESIVFIHQNFNVIEFVKNNFGEIEKIQEAANALIEIYENLDEIRLVNSNVENLKKLLVEFKEENAELVNNINSVYNEILDVKTSITHQVTILNSLFEDSQEILNYLNEIETTSEYISEIRLVAGDLQGNLGIGPLTDLGMVGEPDPKPTEITGGNIKIVADNIEDVRYVAQLGQNGTFDEIKDAKELATTAANNAKDFADKASVSASNAKTSELNIKKSEENVKEAENTINEFKDEVLEAAESFEQINTEIQQTAQEIEETRKQVKQSEINVETSKNAANNSANLSKAWAIQVDAPVENGLYGAKYYADLSKTLNDNIEKKAEEVKNDSGTYFIPSIDFEGTLTWTNTGNKENPLPVNIKGPKGDKGEQGWSFTPTAVGTLEERTQHDADPKGSSFLDINSGILYFKLSDTSGDWNEGIPFRGQDGQPGSSANEVLMSPDPVAYFDEIYGKASGDIVGEIIITAPAIQPAPVETFENALK